MKPKRVEEKLESLLEPYPLAVHWQMDEVRKLILSVHPSVTERVYQGWRILKFDDVIYLAPKLEGIYIGFLKGVHLPDPHHLLAGTAKEARRYWWASETNLEERALRELLEAAFAPLTGTE